MADQPLVSIMIATKNRHDDLSFTLKDLKRQDYPAIEMLVIDDASTPPIESLVREFWPDARVIRYESSRGQTARRNEGFKFASGEFILHLDDDCSPVAPDAIANSVKVMQAQPLCAAIAYYVWNGLELPEGLDTTTVPAGIGLSYIGAAGFVRKASVERTAGYREAFFGYAEEEELGLQFLTNGEHIAYRPEMIAHHRFSNVNRNTEQSWKRALRNRLWTIMIHSPWQRVPVEMGWKIFNGVWDGIRLGRMKIFFNAISETAKGASPMLAVRKPLDDLTLRRYDALRAHGTLTYAQFENPPKQGLGNLKRWAQRWPNRLREGSRWSGQKNVGRGDAPTHEHELRR